MKVNDFGKIGSSNPIKKKDLKKASGSDFSALVSGTDEAEPSQNAANLAKVGGISALDSLLAVQSIENSLSAEQAAAHGKELLEFLDDLRMGLLTGSVSQEKIKRLKNGIDSKRGWVIDKKLTQILDEIELRAAVELAKIEIAHKQ